MKSKLRLLLPSAISIALAACVNTQGPPRAPRIRPPAASLTPVATAPSVAVAQPVDTVDDWAALRASFAMSDCDGDPAVLAWAHRYTRNPQRFEAQMREVLPRLAYVQQIADKHGVAGEFVLLPWVESQFRPLFGRRDRPAGMWQIMPDTASSMGLKVDGKYDGRLDVPAAADAVMELLSRYHDDLHDWRLVNYAYNAGEFSIRKMVDQQGPPPAQPLIPRLPVKSGTREHLVRLLAISCVIRDPARFQVSLPQLPAEQRLVSVPLPRSMPIATAADQAGMSINDVYGLNAGFRDGMAGKAAAPYLLLPSAHAQQLRNALQQNPISDPSPEAVAASLAAAQPSRGDEDEASSKSSRGGKHGRGKSHGKTDTSKNKLASKTHKVGKGENLWTIARRYKVEVGELKRWNHLTDATALKPGQVIRVSG